VDCPFCRRLDRGDVVAGNGLAVVFPDASPLNPGHTLIVPRRHEPDFLALSPDERAAVFELLDVVRSEIERAHRPDGYNIGVNVGDAAGQTVGHAHLHVIPRYAGDVDDPRGGIRWILPARARYWTGS
jgi:diadenosine tetraphosphate (Ap4A) HIT family hydrolase